MLILQVVKYSHRARLSLFVLLFSSKIRGPTNKKYLEKSFLGQIQATLRKESYHIIRKTIPYKLCDIIRKKIQRLTN